MAIQASRSDDTTETHLVLIPSYNTGGKLLDTVAHARRKWQPVWVVIDGSTDGTGETLAAQTGQDRKVRVVHRSRNGGKGAAVFDGLRIAAAEGFTHVLVMDADGQHPVASIPEFMRLSRQHPDAMILGVPIFDRDAPRSASSGGVCRTFGPSSKRWALFAIRCSDFASILSRPCWRS